MSASINLALLIQTRLATAPVAGELSTPVDITAIPSNVDRTGNILGDVQAGVQKSSGTFISIRWDGWVMLDANASKPRLANHYTVYVWARTVRDPAALAPEDVIEAVMRRLWQWRPDGQTVRGEAQVGNGGIVPDKSYLVYDCEVVIPASI